MKKYKIEFEVVSSLGKGAAYYTGYNPNCRPEAVPDDCWQLTIKETTDPWQQYNQLKAWATSGEQLIRNVQLFEATIEWVQVNTR